MHRYEGSGPDLHSLVWIGIPEEESENRRRTPHEGMDEICVDVPWFVIGKQEGQYAFCYPC